MKKYQLKNLGCAICAAKMEKSLQKLEYVKFVSVDFATGLLTLDTDNLEKIKKKIKEIEPEVEVLEIEKRNPFILKSELSEQKQAIFKVVAALTLLIPGMIFEEKINTVPYLEYIIFGVAYLIVGWEVIELAARNIARGNVFNEHFLMSVATLGAFAIHQLPEAVAVMLFYVVGEFLQDIAVDRSRSSVKSLLELKPSYANLLLDGIITSVVPESVRPGDIIVVRPGEKIPLDGVITDGNSFVDTSALTGESVPAEVDVKDTVLSGMINLSGLITVRVTRLFNESSIAKILDLVEKASSRKAATEKFITSFARIYTPVVVFSSLLIAFLPPLLFNQSFNEWIYRALVVLVVSCPCALIISIPLGYFGGIGAASRKGILVKGSNYLDVLTRVNTVVFDKTGTLTRGEFKVTEVIPTNGFSKDEILYYAAYAESHSNHPVAKSIYQKYGRDIDNTMIGSVQEKSGFGIKAVVEGKTVIAGNDKLLHKENIDHPVCVVEGTVVHISIDSVYAGYITISDRLKTGALEAVQKLKEMNIMTVMLTGDNQYAAESFAKKLQIERYYAELLPEDKVRHIENLIEENKDGKVAFAGDGINDAPVLARADVGISIGSLASDAAIETADVVIMADSPMKIADAIIIARKTRTIVWQNIFFALGVKLFFIVLGIAGIATMWEAVFGDMGVALIAVFNAMRVLK